MGDPVFDAALRRVLVIERLYSNDARDAGGETVWGVARRRWPDWAGWKIVDAARSLPDFPENLRGRADLDDLVRVFYRTEFWVRMRCDQLPPIVADKVFELGVNAGTGIGAEILQVALTSQGHPVSIDGAVGPATVAAAQAIAPGTIRSAMQAAQAGFYLGIMTASPAKRVWRNGWLARAFT